MAAILLVSLGFVLLQDIKFIASVTDFGALFVFMFVNAALIVVRYRRPDIKGSFRSPLNIGRMPVPAAVGSAFCLLMLFHLSAFAAVLGVAVLAFGVIVYVLFLEKGHVQALEKAAKEVFGLA